MSTITPRHQKQNADQRNQEKDEFECAISAVGRETKKPFQEIHARLPPEEDKLPPGQTQKLFPLGC
jgi:hypothetical protein